MTIDEWKLWYENLECEKSSSGTISLSTLRPTHNVLADVSDGTHPLHCVKLQILEEIMKELSND